MKNSLAKTEREEEVKVSETSYPRVWNHDSGSRWVFGGMRFVIKAVSNGAIKGANPMDDIKMMIPYSEGYRAALRGIRELVECHDLKLTKRSRRHILAALDCIQEEPDRFAATGGYTDLWWKEEGKTVLYSFEPYWVSDNINGRKV